VNEQGKEKETVMEEKVRGRRMRQKGMKKTRKKLVPRRIGGERKGEREEE
jgi:hypothetical protein